MEKKVEELFTKDILKSFISLFSLEDEYRLLGDFENFVYEVYRKGCPLILRITHCSHRKEEDLLSEIDWMMFLYKKRLNVPKAFQSVKGNLIEKTEVRDGTFFYASLFSKAAGKPIKVHESEFNEQLFISWGKAIGRMHAVTKEYIPSPGIENRMQWDEEELLEIEKYVPVTDRLVIQNTKELLCELQKLSKNKDNYGLIHTDAHSGNFFFDGKDIHIFDFDDCCYQWFASDIAIPVYYSTLYRFTNIEQGERNEFGKSFLAAFITGYQEENNIPTDWERSLPLFLKLRDITLYSVLHKKIAPEDRNDKLIHMLEHIKKRIEQKQTIIY